MNFTMAMNNYTFVEYNKNLNYTPYGVVTMNPSSGPIQGSSNIIVKGSGFSDTILARCRFGVEGYYAETNAKFIDSTTIVCPSPSDYKLPNAGQLPFSVPFSIAFLEAEYSN